MSDRLWGGCPFVCVCVYRRMCVRLITPEERVLVGAVLVPAGVSLGEPLSMCVLGCMWNVSRDVDLTLCGIRKVVVPYVRRNLTAHDCGVHTHVCTHIHTERSISAYLDLGSVVNSSVGGKYETSAAAFPGPVGNGG